MSPGLELGNIGRNGVQKPIHPGKTRESRGLARSADSRANAELAIENIIHDNSLMLFFATPHLIPPESGENQARDAATELPHVHEPCFRSVNSAANRPDPTPIAGNRRTFRRVSPPARGAGDFLPPRSGTEKRFSFRRAISGIGFSGKSSARVAGAGGIEPPNGGIKIR